MSAFLSEDFYDQLFIFYVLNFYNDFPKFGSLFIYITLHFIEPSILYLFFGMGKLYCFIGLIIFLFILFSLPKSIICWMLDLLNWSFKSLIFPCFPFLFLFISRKQTRWYLPVLVLKRWQFGFSLSLMLCCIICQWNQSPLLQPWTSFQTSPDLHFLFDPSSLGFLFNLQSFLSPLFLAQEIPENSVSYYKTYL